MSASDVFHRAGYARELARQLLRPGPLDVAVRSGVFLSGIRRVGKTTFLRQDLAPALEEQGAVVIYVDLWVDRARSPSALVNDAVRDVLAQLQTPGTHLMKRFKGLNVGGAGMSFGFQLDTIGTGQTPLAQVFRELVEQTGRDVVLIVDEIQQALTSEDGYNLLHALKAARDAVNARPDARGHFLLLGTGSHKSLITDMASRRAQPFQGAASSSFIVLGRDFVAWQLDRLATSGALTLPSLDVAWEGFEAMGHRPEDLLKAIRQLQGVKGAPDDTFPVICATLASAAADVELNAIEELGELAAAVFGRIASGNAEGVKGLFGADAIVQYASAVGSPVDTPQVQAIIERMIAANLVVRPSHGTYAVADPFVRQVWLDRARLRELGLPDAPH